VADQVIPALAAKEIKTGSLKVNGVTIDTNGSPHTPEGTAILSTGETTDTKFLRTDSDGTCSWQVPNVTKVGTPANNEMAVWTGDGTLEGASTLTFNGNTLGMITTGNVEVSVKSSTNDSYATYSMENDARKWAFQIRSDLSDAFTIRDETAGVNRFHIAADGKVTIGAYTLPATDGTSGQVLTTNGSGVLTWTTP